MGLITQFKTGEAVKLKIIDEKGRLFGRINVIDLMVILFLLSFILILYLGYELTARNADSKRMSMGKPAVIQVRFSQIIPELARVIRPNDVEKDLLDKVIGRVIMISEPVPPSSETAVSKTIIGRMTYVSEPLTGKTNQLHVNLKEESYPSATTVNSIKLKDISAKIDIIYHKKGGVLYYKEQPLKIGKEIVFSTDLYAATGVVTDIELKK